MWDVSGFDSSDFEAIDQKRDQHPRAFDTIAGLLMLCGLLGVGILLWLSLSSPSSPSRRSTAREYRNRLYHRYLESNNHPSLSITSSTMDRG